MQPRRVFMHNRKGRKHAAKCSRALRKCVRAVCRLPKESQMKVLEYLEARQ